MFVTPNWIHVVISLCNANFGMREIGISKKNLKHSTLQLLTTFYQPLSPSHSPLAINGHERCIKVADEAPSDLKSNLRRAYSKFSQETCG